MASSNFDGSNMETNAKFSQKLAKRVRSLFFGLEIKQLDLLEAQDSLWVVLVFRAELDLRVELDLHVHLDLRVHLVLRD